MNEQRPTSERVYRELSADELQRLKQARAETESLREDILAEGKIRKAALETSRTERLRRDSGI
jgi:hypothetical protein